MKIGALRTHYAGPNGTTKLSSVDAWRLDNPLSHLTGHEVTFYNKIVENGQEPDIAWEKFNGYDLVWSSYFSNPRAYAHLRAASEAFHFKIVMDVDDNMYEVDPMAPAYIRYHPGSQDLQYITQIFQDVDYLSASTPYLASVIGRYRTKPIVVLPNLIDPKKYVYDGRKIPNNQDKIVIGYQGCYDNQTEVLTENGFKLFKDLYPEDKIATLNPETNELEYHVPTNHFTYLYSGKMYLGEGRQFNYCVTPNHKMYVKKRYHENYELVEMDQVSGKRFRLKKDVLWKGKHQDSFTIPEYKYDQVKTSKDTVSPSKQVAMNDWLTFFGFWLAEGWTTKSIDKNGHTIKHVGIVQGKQNGYLDTMNDVLTRMGFKTFPDKRNQIRVFDCRLWSYLRQLGGSHDKYIPQEIKQLSPEQLRLLLEWYLNGDGSVDTYGKITAFTASKRLADDLVEIALKIGWSANLYIKKPGNGGKIDGRQIVGGESYIIRFLRDNGKTTYLQSVVYPKHERTIDYDGEVYCVDVPNHILYVRRNGKCMWSGNSATHYADLVETGVLYALRRLVHKYPQVDVNIVGCIIDDFLKYIPEGRIRFTSGAPDHREWVKLWQTLDFDIGLAPLKPGGFNRSKSNIKYQEYGLRKIPGLYSFIDPYLSAVKDNQTGFIFQDEEEFFEKCSWLIENETLRKRMGDQARTDVLKNWTIKKGNNPWQSFLDSL